jgi:hypothetical protein
VANLVANREFQRDLQLRDRWIFSELFMACIRWQRPIPLSQVQSAALFAMKSISVTSSGVRAIVVKSGFELGTARIASSGGQLSRDV